MKVEVYLSITVQNDQARTLIVQALESSPFISTVMMIGESNELELSFACETDQLSLRQVMSTISTAGAELKSEMIHLPAEISGITDAYGLLGLGEVITEKLKTLQGIDDAGISSHGIVKLQLKTPAIDEDELVHSASDLITAIRNENC